MTEIQELLKEVQDRTQKGHPNFYKPFNQKESFKLKQYYIEQLPDTIHTTILLVHLSGLLLAHRFERIVVGDYGAYIEVFPKDMYLENICQKWPGQPKRPVKYIWMQLKNLPKGYKQIVIYFQQATVSYADYKPGMYYINPKDIILQNDILQSSKLIENEDYELETRKQKSKYYSELTNIENMI